MEICSSCLVTECIQGSECVPYQPGGFSKLWIANVCKRTLAFAEAGNYPYAIVEGVTLAAGSNLYTVDFSKQTGMLLDSVQAAVGDGYNWTHTLTIPLKDAAAVTMGLAESFPGSELTVFAQRKSGEIVVVGIGADGLRLSAGTLTNGRIGSDARVNERTFTLIDSYTQAEFVAAGAPTDPNLRIKYNVDYLNALVNCGYGSYAA